MIDEIKVAKVAFDLEAVYRRISFSKIRVFMPSSLRTQHVIAKAINP